MTGRSRGVSTVLDVTVFLLLVTAAVFSLATAGTDTGDFDTADRDEVTVETLATTTATVQYDLGVEPRTNATISRVRHGTLASLLAEAALATVAVDGERMPHTTGFVSAVRRAVTPVLDGRTQIVATWTPFPGSSLRGRVTVGPTPPPAATVHAATLAVDSGIDSSNDAPGDAAVTSGYRGVADVVAADAVDGLVPPRQTRAALDGEAVDATVTRAQFDTLRSAYGTDETLADGVVPARDALATAVSNRTHGELRAAFETPRTAASSLRLDRVTIVVRTWS